MRFISAASARQPATTFPKHALAAGLLAAALLLPGGCFLVHPSGPAPAARPDSATRAGAAAPARAEPQTGPQAQKPAADPAAAQRPSEKAPSLSSPPASPPAEGRLAVGPDRPEPPALTVTEARRQLPSIVPPDLLPLAADGRTLLQLVDLNQDGEPEGFALAVAREAGAAGAAGAAAAASGAEPAGSADTAVLSDYARLFAEGTPPVDYQLLVLGSRKGRLYLARAVPLGAWQVFEQFRAFPLAPSRPAPVAVSVSFQTPEGSEEKLLLFREAGAAPSCTLDLKKTSSTQARLRDIDHDGVLDLLVQERGMEEGTGYETFLTWYRWNGRCLVEQRTLNVVRNLNAFLQQVRELLVAADYPRLAHWALDPRQVRALEARGLDPQAIVFRIMGLEVGDGTADRPSVEEIVFPQILESPFTTEDERGARFRLGFRWVSSDGLSLVSELTVYLLAYPFGDRQFSIASD